MVGRGSSPWFIDSFIGKGRFVVRQGRRY